MRKIKYPKLGYILKKYRKDRDLRQKDVAKILGLKSSSMISRWEKGLCLPDTRNICRLSELYRRMADDLLKYVKRAERERIRKREKKLLTEKHQKQSRAKP